MNLLRKQREGIKTIWQRVWLLVPLLLFLGLFLGLPAVVNVIYSLSDVTFETLRNVRLTGIGNYVTVLQDEDFWQAGWFSLRFALVTATAECVLGLALAIFLAPLFKRHTWLLGIIMMPLMVAPALIGLMYRLVLHEFVGPVPYYLWEWFNDSPAFLNATNAFWTLAVIEILQWTPFALLIFYAAYQTVPEGIREAARIDGAGAWQMLARISLPLMVPALITGFLIRFIDSFRVFDNVFVLTRGGAGGSTTSLSIYIYLSFFQRGDIGEAVAASMIFLVAAFALLFALNQATTRART
jgi:multiple sugar transport system permease protein